MDLCLLHLYFEIFLAALNDFEILSRQLRQLLVLLYPWQIFAGTNLL
jgi:hypothetical protein